MNQVLGICYVMMVIQFTIWSNMDSETNIFATWLTQPNQISFLTKSVFLGKCRLYRAASVMWGSDWQHDCFFYFVLIAIMYFVFLEGAMIFRCNSVPKRSDSSMAKVCFLLLLTEECSQESMSIYSMGVSVRTAFL